MTTVIFRPEARVDAIDAFRWYEERSRGLGIEFRNALDATVDTVPGIANVVALSAGVDHTCAVLDDGAVYCWGHNDYGQLGNNSTVTSPVPVRM